MVDYEYEDMYYDSTLYGISMKKKEAFGEIII